MRGKKVALSAARKLVVDWTRLQVPSVPVQRVVDLSKVIAARAELVEPPQWSALFTKAYGLVSAEMPALRRAYVKLPRPHLYEYPVSVASFVLERVYRDEHIVLTILIRAPETTPITKIADAIRRTKTEPVQDIRSFRKISSLARLPTPLRRGVLFLALNLGRQRVNYFGTFGISVYSELGAESLHPLSPLTAILNYGVIGDDGKATVRIIYDHRVLDGADVARALKRLEERINDDIVNELQALGTANVSKPHGAC